MECPNCRQPVDMSGYCTRCGISAGARLCPNGHLVEPGQERCVHCGQHVSSAATGSKGRTLVENLAGARPHVGGGDFLKGAGLLDDDGIPGTKGRTAVEGAVPSSKKKTTFDSGLAGPAAGLSASSAPASSIRLVGWLVTFSHDPSGKDFRIREGRNTIGSGAECDVRVGGDTSVSQLHAVLMFRDGRFQIRDNDSVNGTYVNGEDIFRAGGAVLQDGDRLRLGATEFTLYVLDK